MLHFPKWKVILILAVCIWGVGYAAPNMMPASAVEKMQQMLPGWLPGKTVNLGLDLRGGSHLLLQVDVGSVIDDRLESLLDSARTELRNGKIGYSSLQRSREGLKLDLRDISQTSDARKILARLDDGLNVIDGGEGRITVELTDAKRISYEDQAISQSIEIVRRRIDESGTKEPIIQRQGRDRILLQLPGVDNPQRVKELLGRTAKMTFHLVDIAGSVDASGAGHVPVGSMLVHTSQKDGSKPVLVKKRAVLTGEMLVDAYSTFHEGRPAVGFRFDAVGTRKFCDVTRANTGHPFAIVLDDEVISAPVIDEPICSSSGVIRGQFTSEEAQDLSLLLRAGALPAPLVVMEERTVGPSLGADSVKAGKVASVAGLLFVVVFMFLAYGFFGFIADIALLFNVAMIFAALSMLQATLTLPGIAGIVLTMGMAVDANVLIYERIREEIAAGRSPMSAVDTGYNHAMSSIVDANLTTLIAALFLYAFGTGPIKGFAVTLSIGVVTSMFSAIMLTRFVIATWLRSRKPKTLNL